VADEDAAASFALTGRAVELGYDLRLVCRELSRVVRDVLVIAVDPSRVNDPEIAGEGERDRLTALGGRFSREDLLRAFDLLTRAESEIRGAAQPRYHLEIALLRWMYLRKLVPIEELIAGTGSAGQGSGLKAQGSRPQATVAEAQAPRPAARVQSPEPKAQSPEPGAQRPSTDAGFKDALLAEIRKTKAVFYNTVVAQAQKIEVGSDRVVFTFSSTQRALRDMFERERTWLESVALQITGRRVAFASVHTEGAPVPAADAATGAAAAKPGAKPADRQSALREQALADAGVQALLEVFPAEIRDVEEM